MEDDLGDAVMIPQIDEEEMPMSRRRNTQPEAGRFPDMGFP